MLAFIVFLLLKKIKLSIYYDGNIKLGIRFLFIEFNYSIPILYREKNYEDLPSDEVLKEKVETESKKQSEQKSKTSSKKNNSSPKTSFPGIKNTISFFKETVISLLGKVIRAFRLEKFVFKAVAGGEDASSVAVLYGHLCTVASSLHQFASNAKGMKDKNVYIEIIPDFLAQTSDFYAEMKLSIRIWRALLILKNIISVRDEYKNMAQKVHKEKSGKCESQQNKNVKQPT